MGSASGETLCAVFGAPVESRGLAFARGLRRSEHRGRRWSYRTVVSTIGSSTERQCLIPIIISFRRPKRSVIISAYGNGLYTQYTAYLERKVEQRGVGTAGLRGVKLRKSVHFFGTSPRGGTAETRAGQAREYSYRASHMELRSDSINALRRLRCGMPQGAAAHWHAGAQGFVRRNGRHVSVQNVSEMHRTLLCQPCTVV